MVKNSTPRNIVTVYRGDDPKELERIKETLDGQEIKFYQSLYLGFIGPLDSEASLGDRLKFFLFPHIRWGYYVYCKKKGYRPHGFQIQVLQQDEKVTRKLLTSLGLRRELCVENSSIVDKFLSIFSPIAHPLLAWCLGIFILLSVLIYPIIILFKILVEKLG